MKHVTKLILAGLVATGTLSAVKLDVAQAEELSLAYFMGPKHPMNNGLMTPFGEKLAELSDGRLTVKQFPGGALNGAPPKQYAILLDGVADIVFTLPGYTADVFPKTNVVGLPGVCNSAVECTEALQRARDDLEKEYNAKVIALWANAPPVLITKDKPVTKLSDLEGMKVRVTSKGDVPFVEALGASAITQPVNVINQNLANGVIDAIMIDPSAIGSFKLYEPANYVTTWFPGSGSSFALLMNKELYDGLSDEDKAAVDAAASAELALGAGKAYDAVAGKGLSAAEKNNVQLLEWDPGEREKVQAAIDAAMVDIGQTMVGDAKVADVMKKMMGQ
ncbi:MAG: TRAP transporter substrate-binding protein [Stappiaceae bacterium]